MWRRVPRPGAVASLDRKPRRARLSLHAVPGRRTRKPRRIAEAERWGPGGPAPSVVQAVRRRATGALTFVIRRSSSPLGDVPLSTRSPARAPVGAAIHNHHPLGVTRRGIPPFGPSASPPRSSLHPRAVCGPSAAGRCRRSDTRFRQDALRALDSLASGRRFALILLTRTQAHIRR